MSAMTWEGSKLEVSWGIASHWFGPWMLRSIANKVREKSIDVWDPILARPIPEIYESLRDIDPAALKQWLEMVEELADRETYLRVKKLLHRAGCLAHETNT